MIDRVLNTSLYAITILKLNTALKVSVFEVILVRIFPHSD